MWNDTFLLKHLFVLSLDVCDEYGCKRQKKHVGLYKTKDHPGIWNTKSTVSWDMQIIPGVINGVLSLEGSVGSVPGSILSVERSRLEV